MQIVRRKWGWYWTLIDKITFKVKILIFKKNGRLSNQYHTKRNELWLFMSGQHKGTWRHYKMNKEHTYYANNITIVVEIQYGRSCIEEDIVRL